MLSLEKIYMYNCQRADSVSLEYDNLSGSYIYARWDTCTSTRLTAELSIYCWGFFNSREVQTNIFNMLANIVPFLISL